MAPKIEVKCKWEQNMVREKNIIIQKINIYIYHMTQSNSWVFILEKCIRTCTYTQHMNVYGNFIITKKLETTQMFFNRYINNCETSTRWNTAQQ